MLINWLILHFFYLLLSSLLTPSPVQAQIIINEVHPNPSSGADWIELFNLSPVAVNLTGWELMDSLSSPSVLHTFAETVVEPLHFLVIEVSNKLNNSGDSVTIFDQEQNIIDNVSFGSLASATSWSREIDGLGLFIATTPTRGDFNNQGVLPTFPTPQPSPSSQPSPTPTTQPSPTPSPTTDSSLISLSEVVACPAKDETEWVELFNNSPQRFELTNWKILDANNNSRTFSMAIDPWSYAVFSWPGSLLNNTGDQVRLIDQQGLELDILDLTACNSGTSLSRFNQDWEYTTTPTPGSANLKNASSPVATSSATTIGTEEKTELSTAESDSAPASDSNPAVDSLPTPFLGQLPNPRSAGEVLGATISAPSSSYPNPSGKILSTQALKTATLSVIIGVLCLTLVNCYSVYEAFINQTTDLD